MPVLIGWSAVTGSVSWSAVHPLHGDLLLDAAALLAAVACATRTTTPPPTCRCCRSSSASSSSAAQIVAYSWAMVLTSLALVPVQSMGWVYTVAAVVAGALFLAEAHRLLSRARAGVAEDVAASRCACSTSRSPT